MKKISVILPTYNSEKYIEKCVKSILNQTYSNIELIIIDDNSTDSTPRLLTQYAEHDQRIKLIINSKNKGTGASRNIGLSQLTGYYTTFMDHDDWQDLDRYEKMIQQLEQDHTDICFSYAVEFYQQSQVYEKMNYPTFESSIASMQHMRAKSAYSFFPPWAKIYKTSMIKALGLRFAEHTENSKIFFDDVLFHSLLILSNTHKVSIEPSYAYFHRFHESSNTYKLFDNKRYMNEEYIEILQQALQYDTPIDKNRLIRYYYKMINFNLLSIKQLCQLFTISPTITLAKALSFRVVRRFIIEIKIKKSRKIIRLFGIYLLKEEG